MIDNFTVQDQASAIELIFNRLRKASDLTSKLNVVSSAPQTLFFLSGLSVLNELIERCDEGSQFVLKSLLALGQGPIVFQDFEKVDQLERRLQGLIDILQEIEAFYEPIGGIVGYHLTILKLILAKNHKQNDTNDALLSYREPLGIDLTTDSSEVRKAVCWGLEQMHKVAEIYPLGGAGDRLNLRDELTNEPLPAAQLLFCGKSLLEGLIRDLQGREFLLYKLFGKQIVTPVAMMTSHEKNNHQRILNICESQGWFGRPREKFTFFTQPLVPMLTIEGNWAIKAPLQLILKPGGHGMLWKLAQDKGIFEWLSKASCTKSIIRQINNPVAGLDKGIIALIGIGCQHNKDFGFASCCRLLKTSEGMDVLKEKKDANGYEYCITNVEYTEFEKCGIPDLPIEAGSPYSRFPANTNLLFADLQAVSRAIKISPIPGMLINMKNMVPCYDALKGSVDKQAGRLESTMQNIADYMVDRFQKPLSQEEHSLLRTYITSNTRSKTLSVAKQAYIPGKSFLGTPEGCFYEFMQNYRELLLSYCGMQLPLPFNEQEYLEKGPEFVALFHPALGVLYSIIGQKIRGGRIAQGSEWIMEIAEAEIVNLDLEGSLIIEADALMGFKNEQQVIVYDSSSCGKCTLNNVKVRNQGIDYTQPQVAWKRQVTRKESLRIHLEGNGEFFAENVCFEGDMEFQVPNGHRLVVYTRDKEMAWHYEKIEKKTWEWIYLIDEENKIKLEKWVNLTRDCAQISLFG